MAFSFEDAAHLLRRLGFGGPPEEIEDLMTRGREGAVDFLINRSQNNDQALEDALGRSFDFSNPFDNQKFNANELRRWWVTRMVLTKWQFAEKMTFFWHNHFATAISKVNQLNGAYMLVQNRLLRDNALARFDDLLLKVSQDAAMQVWLDGITNVRGRANENFGRELMELFTMGINDVVDGTPNYTEDDVKEVARAFTGWNFRRPNQNDPSTFFNYPFVLNANQHDNGQKTIFGQTANFSGEDVISTICNRRATARFLVWKMFNFFVYPLTKSQEDLLTIDRFADVYMSRDHSIKELARAIFASDEFFSNRAMFSLVKSPLEFIVGAIRMLGASYNPGTTRRDGTLYTASRQMGVDLFEPPDVSGHNLGLDCINTATMLTRFNFANTFVTVRPNNQETVGAWITPAQLSTFAKASPKKTVKGLFSILGPLAPGKPTMRRLIEYLETTDQGGTQAWVVNDANIDKKIRGLIHQILCLPEFNLN
jgi:uncharacterized protein (DUF1800 family)